MEAESQTTINSAVDIVTARQRGRALALELGFNGADVTLIAAAITEVARNIVQQAKTGESVMSCVSVGYNGSGKTGNQLIARDQGLGIRDAAQPMQYGYSTR